MVLKNSARHFNLREPAKVDDFSTIYPNTNHSGSQPIPRTVTNNSINSFARDNSTEITLVMNKHSIFLLDINNPYYSIS